MRRLPLLATVVLLSLCATATGTAVAAQSFFRSPSGSVSCELDSHGPAGTGAFCETFGPARSVTMRGSGAIKTCTGERCLGNPPQNTRVLAYGKRLRLGPFVCVSRTSGVRCTVRGAGFVISRSGVVRVNR